MTAAIILCSIAATNLIWTIIITVVSDNAAWLFSLILSFTLSVFGLAAISNSPTNSDIKKGKAYYVEQNHIEVLNGDTVNTYKTYSIEWKTSLDKKLKNYEMDRSLE
jgi:hypothetical protein